ncbi:hypothetical protein ES703_51501 [subsurface metagenome]
MFDISGTYADACGAETFVLKDGFYFGLCFGVTFFGEVFD